MSLRLRLSLLFSSLVGGVLLIFGAMVYGFRQPDSYSPRLMPIYPIHAQQVIESLKVDSANRLTRVRCSIIQPAVILFFKCGTRTRPCSLPARLRGRVPWMQAASGSTTIPFHIQQFGNFHLRVLSIPIETERGPVGILQLAQNLALLDATQRPWQPC